MKWNIIYHIQNPQTSSYQGTSPEYEVRDQRARYGTYYLPVGPSVRVSGSVRVPQRECHSTGICPNLENDNAR
jgi:hypothetical protein